MAHLAGNPEAQQPGHNRLGRLFSSLVDGDTLPDVFSFFAEKNEGLINSSLAPKHSGLDIENLSRELVLSAEPLRILKAFVADVTRGVHHHGVPTHTDFDTVSYTEPSDYKLYFAERLRDAGIEHIKMPYHAGSAAATHERYSGIRVVRLPTNGLFYIRAQRSACPYQEHLQLLEIESILNTALLANHYFLDANMASREDLLLFEQTYTQSIAAQAPAIVSRPHDKAQDGEWVVRKAISLNIESLRLPHRLELDFRTHVHTGRAAFRIKLLSPNVFPKVQYHAETGFTPTTDNSRKK
ncbi:MAG: tetratricopeptide repeat protein, partial [Lancefieldella rimae]|nr:tetratricopeptide repeat protein [Lancefieldella rimae]